MSEEITTTILFLFVIIILLVVMRAFVAPMVIEKQHVNVLASPSQWSPQVTSLPNSTCSLTGTITAWPPRNEDCMLEGINRYMSEYQRTCEVGNCIDFSGDKVNGNSNFSGMCSNSYCGMSQCKISFSNPTTSSSYVTVTRGSATAMGDEQLILQQGGGSIFMMRRMSLDKNGEMIADMHGIFAIFVYYNESANPNETNQYLLCYNNHYAVTDSTINTPSFVTKLILRPTETFGFPNASATNQNDNVLSLFILMDTLSQNLLGTSGGPDNNRTMNKKILCIFGSASSDKLLMTPPYISSLQSINGKNPTAVFNQGLQPLGCGIFSWYSSAASSKLTGLTDGFYSINSNYITIMITTSTEAEELRRVTQDILELRLSNSPSNLPFYSWIVGVSSSATV